MKPGGQYRKGSRFERERVKWHYLNGAAYAARIAGSHSPFDVVAVYDVKGWLCVEFEQLKSRKEKVSFPLPPSADAKVHAKLVVREGRNKWRVELASAKRGE